jgi:hypothetical protein
VGGAGITLMPMLIAFIAQTYPSTFPAIPPAPARWTDPSAFGYVVMVLLFAAVAFLWAKAHFLSKKVDTVDQRQYEIARDSVPESGTTLPKRTTEKP